MSAGPSGTTLTVLYIEDNASNLQLVKRILRDRDDIALHTASRGQEGIEMARAVSPGLILLDLHLPDMSGVDVLESLRADPVTAAIPVVAVSADATADQIHHVRGSGVADYVTKPFEVPRLLAVIDSFAAREPVAPAVDEDLVLDQRRVAELVGLDADGATFRSLVAVALEEAADQIAAIGDVPGAGQDSAAVRAAAHGLKSSAGIVGARRLASLADAIEQAALDGALPDPSTLSELHETYAVTRAAALDAKGGQ